MDLFGTLIAVFIGIGLVSKEIERRSLYPLLAKPLSRDEFFLGKFAGLAFTLLVNLAVMTAGLYLTLLAHRRRRPTRALLAAVYPIFLGLLLVVAIAMLFSTLTLLGALAAVFTVGVVVAGRFSDVIRNMREVAPGVPAVARSTRSTRSLPNFRNFDLKDRVAYGDPVSAGRARLGHGVRRWPTSASCSGSGLASFRSRDFQ